MRQILYGWLLPCGTILPSAPVDDRFADGSRAKSLTAWTRRRAEMLQTWHKRLGPWPPLDEWPVLKKLAQVKRDGYTERGACGCRASTKVAKASADGQAQPEAAIRCIFKGAA